MNKALKIIGLVVMLAIFFLLGAFFGSFIINGSLLASLLSTILPSLLFGLLTGLAIPRIWLLSGVASLGYVLPGILGGYPTIGPSTLTERLIFLVLLPIVSVFLGGYIGKWLRH